MDATFNPAPLEGGELTLDVVAHGGAPMRLRTIAPLTEAEITFEPTYEGEGRTVDFGPGYFWHPPTLAHVDVTVRVRMLANSTPDGTLYTVYRSSAITPELRLPHDDLKSLRETLARVQTSPIDADDSDRIGRIIAEIDRQRPLGTDGKHGDLHTPTCGCDR